MIESRIPRARLILSALAAVLLTGCGDATESRPGKSPTTLERDLRQKSQEPENSPAALAAGEQRAATLGDEPTRDRRRPAELTARSADLERRNRELAQQLARARSYLAQTGSLQTTLRQQHDQNVRQVRALSNDRQALRSSLANAHGEIRLLRAQQSAGQRGIADLRYRGGVTARELEELRRYNGFLLQERSNLQSWLQEANATRKQQQDALDQSQQEADRIKSSVEAANRRLRVELEKANQTLAELETSRDTLASEAATLRAVVARATEAERSRNALEQQREQQADTIGDAIALRAELEQATGKIAKLLAARDYLVEKIEACTLQQQSSRAKSMQQARHLALLGKLVRSRSETVSQQRIQGRFMPAHWQPGPAIGISRHARLIPVATQTDEQPRSTRRERELDEAKKKVEELEQEHTALTTKLQEREAECAAIEKRVQTLTWANEVLVKELEAAYDAREAGDPRLLPKGTRGIYTVRQGESLSQVAKAFYGEPGRWRDLVEANKDKIPDPHLIEPGTIILIPE